MLQFTRTKHRANECKNENTYTRCKRKHHTSIFEKSQDLSSSTQIKEIHQLHCTKNEEILSGKVHVLCSVAYPVGIISVDGVGWRTLLNTRAGSSYMSLHKKWSFPLRISSINLIQSAGNCGFGHIYWRNPRWKTSFFVQYYFTKIKTQERPQIGQIGDPVAELTKLGWQAVTPMCYSEQL